MADCAVSQGQRLVVRKRNAVVVPPKYIDSQRRDGAETDFMWSTFTFETGDLTLAGTNKEKRMSIAT